MTLVRVVLGAHLCCAFGATAAFWWAAGSAKGGERHRLAGRLFTRLLYLAAATGGLLAIVGLIRPSSMSLNSASDDPSATRRLMWLVLYFLAVIVAAAQHGRAVIAAGVVPLGTRSRAHASLNLAAIAGSFLIFPAAIAWHLWPAILVAPAGFTIGLRNMGYASRASVTGVERDREHLTSMITAGIFLHTAFFVLSAVRGRVAAGPAMAAWMAPLAIGLPVIVWQRARRGNRARGV